MHDPAGIVQSRLGVQTMIFISLLESELMIPSKIKSRLLDDDFKSSNAWHLKGRCPFNPIGVR